MKIKLISSAILSVTVFFASFAYAELPPEPAKCPGTSTIASVGIENVEQDHQDGTWGGGVAGNNYDTTDRWTFAVIGITANDASDARVKAVASLKSLQFKHGPIAFEDFDIWACFYKTAQGYNAVTVTPALGLSPSKIAILLNN